jgi:hypothetical protein
MQFYDFKDLDTELQALEDMSDLCACVSYNVDYKYEAEIAYIFCSMGKSIYLCSQRIRYLEDYFFNFVTSLSPTNKRHISFF